MTPVHRIAVIAWLALVSPVVGKEPLSRELRTHGVRQVEYMIKDRPNMGAYATDTGVKLVGPTDPFYEFAVRKFAGEDTDSPVFWDATKPSADAEHRSPVDDHVGLIKVGRRINNSRAGEWNGRDKAFEVLWSQAIFELHNIGGVGVFLELQDRALNGRIERDEYILAMAKNEHVAYLKTNKFFKEQWVPWAMEVKLKPSQQRFYVTWGRRPESFDDWIARYTDRKDYPWMPYGEHFDLLAKYQERVGAPETNHLPPTVDYWRAQLAALKVLDRTNREANP